MNIYIEDIVVLDFVSSFLIVILFNKLLKLKRNFLIIAIAIFIQFSIILLLHLLTNRFKYFLLMGLIIIPILSGCKNINILTNRVVLYCIIFASFVAINKFLMWITCKHYFGDIFLLTFSVDNFFYLLLSKIIDYILTNKLHNEINKKIYINGKVTSAIIDTGNQIFYKGKEVVVLDKSYDIKLSNENILVNTINSSQKYNVGYIYELCNNGKYFYNVPAIIEQNNNKIILPLKYS